MYTQTHARARARTHTHTKPQIYFRIAIGVYVLCLFCSVCSLSRSLERNGRKICIKFGSDQTFRKEKWKLKVIWETSFPEISAKKKPRPKTFQREISVAFPSLTILQRCVWQVQLRYSWRYCCARGVCADAELQRPPGGVAELCHSVSNQCHARQTGSHGSVSSVS